MNIVFLILRAKFFLFQLWLLPLREKGPTPLTERLDMELNLDPMLHGHNVEMDTTRGKFLKIHTTRLHSMIEVFVLHSLDPLVEVDIKNKVLGSHSLIVTPHVRSPSSCTKSFSALLPSPNFPSSHSLF